MLALFLLHIFFRRQLVGVRVALPRKALLAALLIALISTWVPLVGADCRSGGAAAVALRALALICSLISCSGWCTRAFQRSWRLMR